ncbi:HET-domain-containing protein [Paraphaeosphaeria sporulosa]|uniref:HET-domain-containing protein n=1 Tax=Paraphaeosphaeria sporulosa TaxID=1460663 RepID=A0A177CTU3_9PLEO|nr:HET-domain-containing protein [Paraphaeosphaeria sporulosa]OAG10611.1 HET-domain-containing protein [Paraphaeosphaeria sporulosa]
MWLLSVDSLELKEFIGTDIPPYAILSHTWGAEEVSFVEMKKKKYRDQAKAKAGFSKIGGCCARAKKDGYNWAWVDSCCIDKRSSAELSEAINSMFPWYKHSEICYVYLSDVPGGLYDYDTLANSKWFTRGWTLQELLAPCKILFFAQDWTVFGQIGNFNSWVSRITQIPEPFITGQKRLEQACVSQRMFWASSRKTSRPEDWAYSLMGLFGIHMPIIYGEGLEKAFVRLQQEIFSTTPDQSIFAWYISGMTTFRLLANTPACFRNSGNVRRLGQEIQRSKAENSSFHMTNLGLQITLPIYSNKGNGFKKQREATLNCQVEDKNGNPRQLSLALSYLDSEMGGRVIYMCRRPDTWTFSSKMGHPTSICIRGIGYDASEPEPPPAPPRGALSAGNIMEQCLSIISSATNIDKKTLEDGLTFSEIGADSFALVEVMFLIKHNLGVEVDMYDFYANPSIGMFICHVMLEWEGKT